VIFHDDEQVHILFPHGLDAVTSAVLPFSSRQSDLPCVLQNPVLDSAWISALGLDPATKTAAAARDTINDVVSTIVIDGDAVERRVLQAGASSLSVDWTISRSADAPTTPQSYECTVTLESATSDAACESKQPQLPVCWGLVATSAFAQGFALPRTFHIDALHPGQARTIKGCVLLDDHPVTAAETFALHFDLVSVPSRARVCTRSLTFTVLPTVRGCCVLL
jgi:hypothetical protein